MKTATFSPKDLNGVKAIFGFILLSLAFLGHSLITTSTWELRDLSFFFLVYVFAVGYIFVSLFNRKKPFLMSIALSLFYVGCFALNTEIQLFAPFSPVLTAYMILTQITMMALPFLSWFGEIWKRLFIFFTGLSLVFTTYLMLYLSPTYPIGVIGLIAIGLSVHLFIPLFSFVQFIRLIRLNREDVKKYKRWFWAGVAVPLSILLLYMGVYATFKFKLNSVKQQYHSTSMDIPYWMYLRAHYTPSGAEEFFMQNPANVRMSEGIIQSRADSHLPMAIISELVFGKLKLTDQELDALFANMYAHRHENNPRLWSGRDLTTDTVRTQVEVFPEFRMAYVQKTIDVSNHANATWGRDQEAIYTFHLPNGAAGTSLSLWIDGREEKAILSTKSKVRNAYSTIVGRERRDPAMMQWEDGNRLVVNIFPVRPDLPRKFKVGFTIPLEAYDDATGLNDIYFQGPDFSNGIETTQINIKGSDAVEFQNISSGLGANGQTLTGKGKIQDGWHLSWKSVPLSSEPFVFNGYAYKAREVKGNLKEFQPENIVLDVNNIWLKAEFDGIWSRRGNANIYIQKDDQLVLLSEQNHEEAFESESDKKFSVFRPFLLQKQNINPAKTLVITKSKRETPLLSDCANSSFYTEMANYHAQSEAPFKLFDLSMKSCSYVRSLDESGMANLVNGTLPELARMLEDQQFPDYPTEADEVFVNEAKMAIARTPVADNQTTTAPDHLMRAFGIERTMTHLAPFYFKRDSVLESSITLAREAYVVSPYSSLVSLESQADYDRFDLKRPEQDGFKSLGNASILGGGSVPEPEEWALIAMAILFFSWLIYKRFF